MTTSPHKNSDMTPPVFRSDLIGFSDIKSFAINGWEEYLREGDQYLTTARRAFAGQRHAFTAEILYNVIAMAIEKLVMGALMQSGNLPYNHTMRDLAEAMEEHFPGRLGGITERLLALDAYQEICDLDTYHRTPPTMAEIPAMLSLAMELQKVIRD
jgi:tRNA A37 threonylcarbamoyltransferase TsaD